MKTYYDVIREQLDKYNINRRLSVGGFDPIKNTDILAQNIVKALGKDFKDLVEEK